MWVRKNILQQTDEDIEEINLQMEEEGKIAAEQQQQAMIDQEAQQQQDMQNQIAFDAQQQIAQAQVSKEVDKITGPDQGPGKAETASRDHESKMMDKKIELERMKQKKAAPAKKKTVAESAKEMGLLYVGRGRYANKSGVVTHLNESGILVPNINKD
jgi:hypothetical protein